VLFPLFSCICIYVIFLSIRFIHAERRWALGSVHKLKMLSAGNKCECKIKNVLVSNSCANFIEEESHKSSKLVCSNTSKPSRPAASASTRYPRLERSSQSISSNITMSALALALAPRIFSRLLMQAQVTASHRSTQSPVSVAVCTFAVKQRSAELNPVPVESSSVGSSSSPMRRLLMRLSVSSLHLLSVGRFYPDLISR
jgi:hypothetical protein